MTAEAAFWDGIAEKYAAQPVENPDAFDRKIAITKRLMGPGAVVLDVGCGTGSLALRLSDQAGHVHGLDVSPEMVRIARGKAAGNDRVTFHAAPFDTYEGFDDGQFDVVMAWSLLHLVQDRDDALAKLFRLVKPGGSLVTSTVVLGDGWFPYRPMLWAMRMVGKAPYVSILASRTLEDEVRRAGFVDAQAHDVGATSTVHFMTATRPA